MPEGVKYKKLFHKKGEIFWLGWNDDLVRKIFSLFPRIHTNSQTLNKLRVTIIR